MSSTSFEQALIECIPNISEGRDRIIIQKLANAIQSVEGVTLLHTDVGFSANRTVYTFVGTPQAVVKAAYLLIEKASQLIDMSLHSGTHPRIGAVDVCPLVPISGISMDQTIEYSRKLARLVGENLNLGVYCYANSAFKKERFPLEAIRRGEYEGLRLKQASPEWIPDFGPSSFNSRFGAVVIGARNYLIAYNINLSTQDVSIAKQIAADIRESGRVEKTCINNILVNRRVPGLLKSVKAIGWYEEKFSCAQVSTNITDYSVNSISDVFHTVSKCAKSYGIEVTGSEIIGLIPYKSLVSENFNFTDSNSVEILDFDIISKIEQEILLKFDDNVSLKDKIIEYYLKK